jgi:hypothetical protein
MPNRKHKIKMEKTGYEGKDTEQGREGGRKEGHGKKLKRSQFGRQRQVVNLGC